MLILREIYNLDRKTAYIDAIPSTIDERQKRNFENIFFTTSTVEKLFGKDISEMSLEQATRLLISQGFLSTSSMVTMISILRSYVQWCIDTKLVCSENAFDKLSINDIDNSEIIKSMLLGSPERLNNILETAFPPNSDIEFQEQSQLIAQLLYLGLRQDFISSLKKNDICFNESCVINERGEKIILNENILRLAKYCSQQTTLDRRDSFAITRSYSLTDNDYLLRTTANKRSSGDDPISITIIYNRIASINDNYNKNTDDLIKLTTDRIYRSGLFYRLYELEQLGVEITREIVYKHFGMAFENMTTIYSETRKKILDYENWKKAFEL